MGAYRIRVRRAMRAKADEGTLLKPAISLRSE
jgi:hypothetical protein